MNDKVSYTLLYKEQFKYFSYCAKTAYVNRKLKKKVTIKLKKKKSQLTSFFKKKK